MSEGLLDLIQSQAGSFGLNWRLVYGVVSAESHFMPLVCRYEAHFRWLVTPDVFAKALGQSIETEIIQQKTSWGLMQPMGGVARELGFRGYLPELLQPEHGLFWGCKKLKSLVDRYSDLNDAIASYNAGSPRKQSDGRYTNQGYINKVIEGIQETSRIADP